MGGISAIGNKAVTKPLLKTLDYFAKDPAKAIAYTTIASLLIKDGIGCYMYVNQSLNNKKIPEDKRKFVAALDLTNGILMIMTQLLCFFGMRKINKSLFPKLFKKSFDKEGNVLKTLETQLRLNQEKANIPKSGKVIIRKEYDKIKKGFFDIFSFVTELVAATIFAKRVVVPFLATPLADKVKRKWSAADNTNGKSFSAEPEKQNAKEEKQITNPQEVFQIISNTNQNQSKNLLSKYIRQTA